MIPGILNDIIIPNCVSSGSHGFFPGSGITTCNCVLDMHVEEAMLRWQPAKSAYEQ